jgi:hypothetical protein
MAKIRAASREDVPLILSFIKELAEYERLSHEVVATEDSLREGLFGEWPVAEVVIGEHGGFSDRYRSFGRREPDRRSRGFSDDAPW